LELIALREDDVAARSVGVNTFHIKIIAFAVSSLLAGLAGSVYAHYINSIDPYSFLIGISATVLVMVLAGGSGSIVGSILGAITLTLLPEILRQFASAGLRMVIYGAAMTAIILFMPEGFAGLVRQIQQRRKSRINELDQGAPSAITHPDTSWLPEE
jgi:branched-chain amino acid transport system permease protein